MSSPRPSFVAGGFAAIDLIQNGVLSASAGGTAANIAIAMASLGWRSAYMGAVGQDPAGDLLLREFSEAGVESSRIRSAAGWVTPVVLQARSGRDHVWRFSCPVCGARFAKHRPDSPTHAREILENTDAPDVFLFDRATIFNLVLAEGWGSEGTAVVFEPAGSGRPQLFARAVSTSSLVKYSSERAPSFAAQLDGYRGVRVETLGSDGARARIANGVWRHVSGRTATDWVDSAGAGDWTTAGLLDALANYGSVRDALASEDALTEALEQGQIMGARACGWEGVRPTGGIRMPLSDLEPFACPRVVHSL